jgi:hypothetical protein
MNDIWIWFFIVMVGVLLVEIGIWFSIRKLAKVLWLDQLGKSFGNQTAPAAAAKTQTPAKP